MEKKLKTVLLWAIENNKTWKLKSILREQPIVYFLWEDFAEEYMKKRREKKIFLQSLRLTQDIFDTKLHTDYKWYFKEVRHVSVWSDILNCDGVFLWDNKVAIFNIKDERYELYDDSKIYKKYIEIFEKYWNND